ncbi:MAG TPA: LptF/LptG family permease [Rhizomicrobium sp.]|jgi:lipopolysaccharide export system permease protein
MLIGYLRRVFIVTASLLAIGLTIDLWPQFHLIAGRENSGVASAVLGVVRFCVLRTPDLVAPFLPFAIFLGVVWTEVAHTQSGERVLVWNIGRSPLRCLMPAILLGVILGVVEFTLDAYLGPTSMTVQMRERLGLDGQRLDRSRRGEVHWIPSPGGLLRTEIQYGPPPVLRHLIFYKRDAAGQLTEVDMASTARRLPDSNLWLMRDGSVWTPGAAPSGNDSASIISFGNSTNTTTVPFAKRTVPLGLDPLWLSVFGMEPQYLPLPVLRTLARSDNGALSNGLYSTRLQVLYGETVLPGAMALLAASLSMLFLALNTPLKALVGVVFVGYLAHFGAKACLLMGQNGYMPSVMAGWFVPVALFGMIFAAHYLIERQRRGVGY